MDDEQMRIHATGRDKKMEFILADIYGADFRDKFPEHKVQVFERDIRIVLNSEFDYQLNNDEKV